MLGPGNVVDATFEDFYDRASLPATLLNSVEVTRTGNGTEESRWENGYTFEADPCGPAARSAPCRGASFNANVITPIVSVMPFTVHATYLCDSKGKTFEERVAIAREALDLYEGFQVEQELWTGREAIATFQAQIAGAATLRTLSPFLRNVPSGNILDPGGTMSAARALALLQDRMRDTLGKQVGVVHAPPEAVSEWQNGGNLRVDANGFLRDIFGNVIVAGGGYDGSGPVSVNTGTGVVTGAAAGDPTDGTVWAYGTGPVGVRLGAVRDVADDMGQAFNRATNDVEVTAYRAAGVAFSPCTHYAVRMTL